MQNATPDPQPAQPEAYVFACLAHGAWERALDVIEELGPLPAYAPDLAGAAERLLAEGDHPAALRVASRAVQLDPACAAAHSVLGRAQAAFGDEPAAVEALRRAAELDGHEVASRIALAALFLHRNQPLNALPFVRQALAVAPWDPAARETFKRLRKSLKTALKDTESSKSPEAEPLAAALGDLNRLAEQLRQRGAAAPPPTVSLCLIARNEAANLPRVIESVRGLATEVIVVDTGSTDDTVKIARQLGAKVDHFPWVNDFAAARNHSLKLATGDWILVLDADDEFGRESVHALRDWLRHAPDVAVVGLYRRYPYPDMNRDSVTIQPRLFRNGRGLRYEGAIHERLVTADGQAARPEVTVTAIHYHHGIDSRAALAGRLERNLAILLRSLECDPDDIRLRYYAGITYLEQEEWSEAIPHLQKTVQVAGKDVDLVPKAYACLGFALLKANRPLEAEAALREGLEWYPEYPELCFCLGLTLDSLGRLEEAVATHEAALRGRFGPSMSWHDWSTREEKPHLALCDLLLSLGDPEAASRHLEAAERLTGPRPPYDQIRVAIAQTRDEQFQYGQEREKLVAQLEADFAAGDATAGTRLVTLLLEAGEAGRAAQFVAAWESAGSDPCRATVARGQVLLASQAPSKALDCFRSARESGAASPEAWRGEAEALRNLGHAADAEHALLQALTLEGEAGPAALELGELYLTEHRWEDAARCFQRTLARRDDGWTTWLGLGKAMLRTGNLPVAINCYQRAASLSGGNVAVRVALGEARAYLSRGQATPPP